MNKYFLKGITFAFLSSLFGSYLFIFSKKVLFTITPETFCVYYYLFSSLFFTIYFLGKGEIRNSIKSGFKNFKIFLLIGVIEFLSVISLFSAVKLTDPTVVSFFNNTQTLFIILLGCFFLKEKFNKIEIVGGVITFSGVLMMSYNEGKTTLIATLLTLLSAILFAITVTITKKFSEKINPTHFAYFRSLLILLFSLILVLMNGNISIENQAVKYILLGAFFGPFLNILFYFKSLKFLEASKTSLIRASLPLFVLLNSIIILSMRPFFKEILGGLIIIIGLLILVLGHEKEVKSEIS